MKHSSCDVNGSKPYRSVIFYANDEQKRLAEAYIAQVVASGVFGKKKIAT